MGNLERFLDAARERVSAGAYAPNGPTLKRNGAFVAALRRHATPVIAELKPRSPSEGRLLGAPPHVGSAGEMLAAFRDGGAAAISVLADASFFDGSPALVREAHEFGLPLLFKDFVIDETQVTCAAHSGASAILLIERAFPGHAERREALIAAAHKAGLEVLLEVFDATDWGTANTSKADLIGVNARDLDTLTLDNVAALRLVGTVAQERPVIALSGIDGRVAYREALKAGALAALVGTSLMRAPDPTLALRAMQRPLAKVCGLSTTEDVAAAAAAGADLAGFVVASPGSPREVSTDVAQRLVRQAHEAGMRTVVVSRAPDAAAVIEAARLVRPDYVQIHSITPTAQVRQQFASIPTRLIAAIAPGIKAPTDCDGVLLDSSPAGGSGAVHPWSRAPTGFTLVAGGLDAANVAAALAATGAWGADASSGLESAPGRKDADKIRSFVRAVHAA